MGINKEINGTVKQDRGAISSGQISVSFFNIIGIVNRSDFRLSGESNEVRIRVDLRQLREEDGNFVVNLDYD